MPRIIVKILKCSIFIILMYFVVGRILFIISDLLKYSTMRSEIQIPEAMSRKISTIVFKNESISKPIEKKKKKRRIKKIPFRRKNFGSLNWTERADYKKVLLWTGYGPLQEGMMLWRRVLNDIVEGKCPESRCEFTTDKSVNNQNHADAVLFHMPNFHWDSYDVPEIRKSHQNWIFMTYETSTNVRMRSRRSSRQVGEGFRLGAKYPPINWSRIDGTFNRTFSFRSDSDAQVQHGYVEKLPQDSSTDLPPLPAWTSRFDQYNQHNFNTTSNKQLAPVVWFVSHCQSESGRDRYVRQLAQHIGVDVYGKCGSRECGKDRRLRNPYEVDTDPCFDLVNTDYKFYLSLENDVCKDYITEKAFNALKLNTIPIIMSGADLKTTLPPHSVIDALEFSPQQLAQYLYTLLRNKDEYLRYFSWRQQFRVVSHESVPSPCNLCSALHSDEWKKPKTYDDMNSWFNRGSDCRSWDGVYPRLQKKNKIRKKSVIKQSDRKAAVD